MALHKNLQFEDIHISHAYEYADETARLAATFVAIDLGKIAFQQSDSTFWILRQTSPAVWLEVGGSSGGGGPPLSNVPPVDVTKTAASAGSSLEASRQDHKHDVSTAAAVSIGTANAEGSSASLSRADHGHDHGNQSVATHHAVVTTGAHGFMSSTDKSKLDGVATGATNTPLTTTAPVNVTKAAASAGTSAEASRQDHKHDVSTAAATDLAVGGANAEGSATTLSRSDHGHQVQAATPVSVGTANAAGSASTFVRGDHVHAGLTRGASDFTTFSLKSSLDADDVLLIEDSEDSNAKKRTTFAAFGGGVFGQSFQREASLGASGTTSNLWQDKVTLTTPALTGVYRAAFACEWETANAGSRGPVRLYNVTDDIEEMLSDFRGVQSSIYYSICGLSYITFTGASKVLKLQWRSFNNTTEITVRRAHLEFWRVG